MSSGWRRKSGPRLIPKLRGFIGPDRRELRSFVIVEHLDKSGDSCGGKKHKLQSTSNTCMHESTANPGLGPPIDVEMINVWVARLVRLSITGLESFPSPDLFTPFSSECQIHSEFPFRVGTFFDILGRTDPLVDKLCGDPTMTKRLSFQQL